MNIIGLITARGGSKTVPRKNIKLLAGKPLIAWTIEAALNSDRLSRVIVSTDDREIAQVAESYGAQVPFIRPVGLAQDASPHIAVVEHCLQWLQEQQGALPDYIMLLQPTSPFRTTVDIDAAIQIAAQHRPKAVVSVCEASDHPYLVKQLSPEGILSNFMTSDISYLRRQDLPLAFALNGAIYLNQPVSLLEDRTFLPEKTYAYVMPSERSLDIDTAWDFYLADLILRDNRESNSH